tara:strand:+ start:431 stop:643 length:213 start_codon:yes stop_codon:yes gene_type:complete
LVPYRAVNAVEFVVAVVVVCMVGPCADIPFHVQRKRYIVEATLVTLDPVSKGGEKRRKLTSTGLKDNAVT